jgi:protein-S-isoprenylcysteine O-methyltransferase Ste14
MYSLPIVYFRREGRRFGLCWWLTGAPFGLAFVVLASGYLGHTSPLVAPETSLARALEIASVPFAAAYIALIAATAASHRVPPALWHQTHDVPAAIVTHGPYRWVRHPFYVAFTLLLAGAALATPQIAMLACLVAGVVALRLTAAREERRILASELGAEYERYRRRTGCFVPRVPIIRPLGRVGARA